MAITFTNKAAGEMRERVDNLVGFGSESIWVSTFHSSCVRILRRYIDRLGYSNNFTIYDMDDQKTVIKDICKRLNIDTKIYKERALLSTISSAKDELISPEEFANIHHGDFAKQKFILVYQEYQKQLKKNNALDFDDLIVKTVELFRKNPDVLESYQDKFRYIMVDEYQDTNTAQFKFISIIADKYKNLCVVGDDDQSIYKFRGANIENILSFEKVFSNARVIKLEQNYRSTKNILESANRVIQNNLGRKDKSLWTEHDEGEKVFFHQADNAYDEATMIADEIKELVVSGEYGYNDIACLYRTNAQSRIIEEQFIRNNIPYKIIGGVNFYQRKEIKDILAYLKTIDNANDDLAIKRIINVPKRGIGLTTMDKIQNFADERDLNFYDALTNVEEITSIGRALSKVRPFVNLIQVMRSKLDYISLKELIDELLEETGYLEGLILEGTDEAQVRIDNINELITKIVDYEEKAEEATLSGFLEEVALIADIDNLSEVREFVVLMTVHSSKGLEFPKVFLTGMEDGLFPSYMTIKADDPSEIEEERRLCYVALTRAMRSITITCAKQRMIRGETHYNKLSRFINEIPLELIDTKVNPERILASSGKGLVVKPSQYSNAKPIFNSKAFDTKEFKVTKANTLDYDVGNKVKHIKFGIGVVKDIIDGGRDFEVTVEFEKFGNKKMFASFAKLKKV